MCIYNLPTSGSKVFETRNLKKAQIKSNNCIQIVQKKNATAIF